MHDMHGHMQLRWLNASFIFVSLESFALSEKGVRYIPLIFLIFLESFGDCSLVLVLDPYSRTKQSNLILFLFFWEWVRVY